MGAQGNEEGAARGLVLDAGALIAFERANRRAAAFIENALEIEADVVVPASALAQAWRGGPRSARLARLIAGAESDPLDEPRAKEIGERLGSRGASDIADAHVVCSALEHQAAVITSDPADIEALTAGDELLTLVSV
ncbi:MAG TPA: PIN domain-containing protein [Solirubrobacterales bacterium]|nr:PIN domain-containing protein [Solirubrobacterales bacterium]